MTCCMRWQVCRPCWAAMATTIVVFGSGEDIIDGGAGLIFVSDRSDLTQAVNITGYDFTLADGTTVHRHRAADHHNRVGR